VHCPEGYTLTALTSLAAAAKVLSGDARLGFQTPSLAYGAEFILEIEGVEREDVAPA
jgi:molybdate-binding protein